MLELGWYRFSLLLIDFEDGEHCAIDMDGKTAGDMCAVARAMDGELSEGNRYPVIFKPSSSSCNVCRVCLLDVPSLLLLSAHSVCRPKDDPYCFLSDFTSKVYVKVQNTSKLLSCDCLSERM